jgi:CubicO group peptidase (beta-lactamase class C family)
MTSTAFIWIGLLTVNAGAAPQSPRFARLSQDILRTRDLLRVPGLAAAVVEDGRIVWHRDLGFSDVEKRVPVTASTEFCIASVTKTMAAILLMPLARDGWLKLDDRVSRYFSAPLIDWRVTIQQVLSHTSEGNPGEEYLYNGARYAVLSRVIEVAGGVPFHELLVERIFAPLEMADTIPGLGAPGYAEQQSRLARPYQMNPETHQTRLGPEPANGASAATGVVSTVRDLARYATALDRGQLVTKSDAALMFSPTRSTSGRELPYGLGWFVQNYLGEQIVWHFGQEEGYASLFLRFPKRKLTLILLANSNSISDAFRLLDGDVMRSLLALYFFRDVVAPRLKLSSSAQRQLKSDLEVASALADLYIGETRSATRHVRQAIASGSIQSRANLSLMYLLVQLHEPSLKALTERVGKSIVDQHPTLPPALFYLGSFYQQTKRSDAAVRLFEKIAEIEPPAQHWSASLALVELGKWYLVRDPERARSYLQRVVDGGSNAEGAVDVARGLLKQLPGT